MKIVQDKLRNRQALLVSGLITLIFTSLFLFIIYEQRMAAASEGVNRLQARMMDIFNDNELIADAIGERYHHIKTGNNAAIFQNLFSGMRMNGELTPIQSGCIRRPGQWLPSKPATTRCVCIRRRSLFAVWSMS